MEGYNLLKRSDGWLRCRACKNAYEAMRRKSKRAKSNGIAAKQSIFKLMPLYVTPTKRCKSGKHRMTPENTRVVGYRGDKRCNKCYKAYRRKYQRKYRAMFGLDKVYKIYKA